jgi:integrase
VVPVVGKVKLAKLTPMHVQRYVRDELARGKSRNTVQQSLTTLRMALKQAVLWGMLPRNVAALVDGVTPKRPERQPFTADEQRAILEAARSYRLYAVVVLAHATGLRQSELLGLRWSDLDLDGGWLHLRRQLGRDGTLKGLKSEAGQRTLPLPARVVQVLRVHKAAQEVERRTAVYWEDHGLVTCTDTGRPMGHRNAHRAWTQILKRACVAHRGIHHMRHTFITTLAENGVHQRVAQQLAGHADSRMTKEVYTHVTDAMMRAAAEAIERVTDATVGSPGGSPDGNEDPNDGVGDESEGADLRK